MRRAASCGLSQRAVAQRVDADSREDDRAEGEEGEHSPERRYVGKAGNDRAGNLVGECAGDQEKEHHDDPASQARAWAATEKTCQPCDDDRQP